MYELFTLNAIIHAPAPPERNLLLQFTFSIGQSKTSYKYFLFIHYSTEFLREDGQNKRKLQYDIDSAPACNLGIFIVHCLPRIKTFVSIVIALHSSGVPTFIQVSFQKLINTLRNIIEI